MNAFLRTKPPGCIAAADSLRPTQTSAARAASAPKEKTTRVRFRCEEKRALLAAHIASRSPSAASDLASTRPGAALPWHRQSSVDASTPLPTRSCARLPPHKKLPFYLAGDSRNHGSDALRALRWRHQ